MYELIHIEFRTVCTRSTRISDSGHILYTKPYNSECTVAYNRSCKKSDDKPNFTRFDTRWHPFALCLRCDDGYGSGSKSKMHCSDLRMFQKPFIFGRGDTCYQILRGKFHIQIQSIAGSWTPHSVGPKDLGSISVQVHFTILW